MQKRKHHDEQLMRRLYVQQRLTIEEVSDEVGCTYKTARRWLKKHGIEIRSSANGAEVQKERIIRTCPNCGDEVEVTPNRAEKYDQTYCNVDCMAEGYTGKERPTTERVDVNCSACGDTLSVFPSRNDGRHHFCDMECASSWRSENWTGEGNPNYRGGRADYYGETWYEMRDRVRDRDENTCQRCSDDEGDLGVKPHVHHIIPVKSFENPNDAHTMENMVQLCPSCHMKLEHLPPEQQTQSGLGAFM